MSSRLMPRDKNPTSFVCFLRLLGGPCARSSALAFCCALVPLGCVYPDLNVGKSMAYGGPQPAGAGGMDAPGGAAGQGSSGASAGASLAGGSTGGSVGTTGTPTGSCTMALAATGGNCIDATCTGVAAPIIATSTADQGNDLALSCGNGTARDVALLWTAPSNGRFRFTTAGSSFDTVIGLFEPVCGGAELACNNNVGSSPDSKVIYTLTLGQSVLVVVDGNLGDQGTAVVNIEPVTCPGTDLTGQPMPAALTTVGGANVHGGVCGGDGNPERSYVWTPSRDGLYRFSASSDSIHPALYIERGPECGGELLGCNAAIGEVAASVTRWLPAGEPVTIIVDSTSGAGTFSLDIEQLTAPCPVYDAVDKGSYTLSASQSYTNILSPSCVVQPFESYMDFVPEQTHRVYLPVNCRAEVIGDAPFTFYVLSGSQCDGAEVACASAEINNGKYSAMVALKPGTYVLVVELASGINLNYSGHLYCV